MANSRHKEDSKKIQDLLNLLENGENNIKYSKHKSLILLLGNTNSAKSAFTKYVAKTDNNVDNKTIPSYNNMHTYLPNLILDENDKTIYDCPGFKDSQRAGHDIVAAYFISKIIGSADSIKFVFTIDYNSVSSDTKDFISLVKSAVQIVTNIEKFENSIALVVTNVNDQKILKEDANKDIISIAEFLIKVKKQLESQSTEKKDSKNQKFIDTLLQKDGKNYTKIHIIKNTAGVDSIDADKTELINSEKFVDENIQFTTYDKSDFGSTVSTKSRSLLHDLVKTIIKNIVLNIKNIGGEIKKCYQIKEEKLNDFQELRDAFKLGHDALSAANQFSKLEDFTKELIKIKNNLNISISNKNLSNMICYAEYLTFLKTINGRLIPVEPAKWARELSDIVQYLNISHKSYVVYIHMSNIVSEYHIQRDANRYRNMTKNSFETYVTSKLRIIEDIDFLEKIQPDELKTKHLKRLYNESMTYNVDSSCTKEKLVLKGQFVMLTDVKKQKCDHAKVIEIFALNKVFIDTDLDKMGQQVQLSIIAPTWEIVQNAKITLDGEEGKSYDPAKARNGVGPGRSGKDGKPGNPGGPAGNLLGIGQHFVINGNLSISAIGGKGGPGQHGGDGANGEDGFKALIPKIKISYGHMGYRLDDQYVWNADYKMTCNGTDDKIPTTKYELQSLLNRKGSCFVYGKNCTNGGNSGDGGIGGEGGSAIDVVFINLKEAINNKAKDVRLFNAYNNTRIVVHNTKGDAGIEGSDGNVGEPGKSGGYLDITGPPTDPIMTEHNFQCTSGEHSHNTASADNPKAAINVHVPSIIIDYENYLREHLSGSTRESFLRGFLSELENHVSVKNVYDTLAFVEEFRGLEDQFYKLRKQLPFLPFYQSLLNRINSYAEKLNGERQMTEDDKKVLSYLYTATLSKINSINNNAANNLVTDLPGYLDFAINDIKKLKDVSNVVSIDYYQSKYQEVIEEKIKEANNFIDKQIKPEINNRFDELDSYIEDLIKETIDREHATEEEIKKLKERKRQLENALVSKAILGVVKTASSLLVLAGPVGAAAGAVIGTGIGVAEAFILDDGNEALGRLSKLPAGVKDCLSQMRGLLKKKQDAFKEQVNDADKQLKELSKDPLMQDDTTLNKIKTKISVIQTKLEIKTDFLNITTSIIIDSMQEDLADLLQKEKVELDNKVQKLNIKGENTDVIKKINIKQEIVKNIKTAIAVARSPASDFYTKLKSDQTKINRVGDAIQEADNVLDQLKQYEKNIYQIMIPRCKDIENSVKAIEKQLENKSQVTLDVSKWTMKNTLKGVQFELQKMTKGYKVEEDLVSCIEKIDNGMSIMIDLYGHIEEYREKRELAAYIANINSNKARQISINDKQLNDAIDYLTLIIKSNLVLRKYEVTMKAFRQHIYPFADYYEDEFNLPLYLKPNDTNSVLSHAIRKIEDLKSKVTESSVTIYEYSEYINSGVTFSSNSNHASPFYVWKHDTSKLALSRLLDGEEITIKSDITKGLKQNAVKFNVVGIRFKSEDKIIQQELDEYLQDFRVKMTHSGYSSYKCGNNFHKIMSEKETLTYSFANNKNGDPLYKNGVYDRLKNNKPVLSPYTWWNIQLTNDNDTFGVLEKFKDQVIDLELEGIGQYVDQKIYVCNDKLNDYYEPDDTLSETYNIDEITHQNLKAISDHQHGQNRRERRSIDGHDAFNDNELSTLATSGASSDMKSSFINNIFSLMGPGIVMFKNINKITNWFVEDKMNTDQELLNILGTDTPLDMTLSDIQSRRAEIQEVSKTSEDKESPSTSNVLDNSLFYSHGNLLLLDLLVRCKTGVKHKQKGNVASSDPNFEYAHTLAYRGYVPQNI